MSAIAPLRRVVKSTLAAIAHWSVPCVEPVIVDTLPHDTRAFTQGLAIHQGTLYESTGGDSDSSLRRLSADDGTVQRLVPIEHDFAEGIAIVEDRLFQLSWKSGTAREFTTPDLKLVGTHRYSGEGWGLAAVKGKLLSSDGSSRLRFWGTQFEPLGELQIFSNGVPIRWLNDLECVGERIYANVVASPFVVEADASSGRVTRLIDCHRLVEIESPVADQRVLNGIAYHPGRSVFYLTGKQWRSLFVVEIPQ